MDSIKLLLGLDTARMSPSDKRRINVIMEGLGWNQGTHRLHDLGMANKKPRRGFARGEADKQKSEYIAQVQAGGIVIIAEVKDTSNIEPPF